MASSISLVNNVVVDNVANHSGAGIYVSGAKVVRAMRRNEFYIFTHPEFRQELREIFDEVLAALPEEPPPQAGSVEAARLAFEERRRALKAKARESWRA